MTEINVKGFRTDRVRPVRDCDGTLIEMTFEQTGTKIIWLKRDISELSTDMSLHRPMIHMTC